MRTPAALPSHHFSKWIFAAFCILYFLSAFASSFHLSLSLLYALILKYISLFYFSLGETVPTPCPVILHLQIVQEELPKEGMNIRFIVFYCPLGIAPGKL